MPQDTRRFTSLRDYAPVQGAYTPQGPSVAPYTEAQKALRSGWIGTGATLQGAAAVGGRLAGADEFAQRREDEAAIQQARLDHEINAPRLRQLEDAQGFTDYVELARNKVLENLPVVGTIAGGAALGAVAAPAAMGAGAGALAGVGATYLPMSTGENYNEYLQDPAVTQAHSREDIAKQALKYGTGQTALGMLPIAGVLGATARKGLPLGQAIARGAATGSVAEGITETGEEMLQRHGHQGLNPEVQMFDDEAMSRYKNAAFAGIVTGGTFGGLGGGLGAASRGGGLLHTPEGMPDPEALTLFDNVDLGMAARRAVQKAMQAGEDGASALRRFALTRAEDLPEGFFQRLDTLLAQGGLAGVVPHPKGDPIDEAIRDQDAQEQLQRKQSRATMQRLSQADPQLAGELSVLEQIGLDDPSVQSRLDELDVKYSRQLGYTPAPVTRILREHLLDESTPSAVVQEEYAPVVRQLVEGLQTGELSIDDPALVEGLSAYFDNPVEVLSKVSELTSDRPLRQSVDPEAFTLIDEKASELGVSRDQVMEALQAQQVEDTPQSTDEADVATLRGQQGMEESTPGSRYLLSSKELPWDTSQADKYAVTAAEASAWNRFVRDLPVRDEETQKLRTRTKEALARIRKLEEEGNATEANSLAQKMRTYFQEVSGYKVVPLAEAVESGAFNLNELGITPENMGRYSVIRKDEAPAATRAGDPMDMTREEFEGVPRASSKKMKRLLNQEIRDYERQWNAALEGVRPQEAHVLEEILNDLRTRLEKVEKSEDSGMLNRPYAGGKTYNTSFNVVLGDKKDQLHRVHAQDLTMWGFRKLPYDPEQNIIDRAAQAFSAGLSALLGYPHNDVRLAGKLSDGTIIFKSKDGRSVTFGEARVSGAARTKASLNRLRESYAKAEKPEQKAAIKELGAKKAEQLSLMQKFEKEVLGQKRTAADDKPSRAAESETTQEVTGVGETEFAGVGGLADRETEATSGKPRFPASKLAGSDKSSARITVKKGRDASEGIKYSRLVTPTVEQFTQMERATPGTLRRDAAIVQRWVKELNLDAAVDVLSTEQVQKLVDVSNALTNALKIRDPKTGRYGVWVRPDIKGKARRALLAHEFGHVAYAEAFTSASKAVRDSVMSEFQTWREQFGHSSTVGDINLRKKTLSELALGLDKNSHVTLSKLTEKDREYLLDFEEWFSDNVSRWAETNASPKGRVEQFFQYVADLIRDLFGAVKQDVPAKSVAQFMSSLRNGPVQQVVDSIKSVKLPLPKDWNLNGAQLQFARSVWNVLGPDFHQGLYEAVVNEVPSAVSKDSVDRLDIFSRSERVALINTFSTPAVRNRLLDLLDGFPDAQQAVRENPARAVAYGYAYWLNGELSLGNRSELLFGKVEDYVAKTLGVIRQHEQAEAVLEMFAEGGLKEGRAPRATDFVLERQLRETAVQRGFAHMRDVFDKVWPKTRMLLASVDQLRMTGIPALQELADHFHITAGSVGVGETMFAARTRYRGQFEQELHDIFDGKDRALGARVVQILNGEVAIDTPQELDIVSRVHTLLDKIFTYSKRAHVMMDKSELKQELKVGDKYTGYYTRVWDVDKLMRNREEFLKMMENYPAENGESVFNALVKNYGDSMTAEDALKQEHVEGEEVGFGSPWAASAKRRPLGFITKEDAAPFLSDDLGLTLSTYISQQVKRAEYTRRFGVGVPGAKPLVKYLEDAREQGATDADLRMADKAIRGLLGVLGSDINPRFHKLQGALMVVQNFALLGLSTLTSLTDPIGIAVRSSSVSEIFFGYRDVIRNIAVSMKGDKTATMELAEMLGTVEKHNLQEALGYEYGGYFVTGTAKRLNDALFRWNLLQPWTRMTRLAALEGAQRFILHHASLPEKDSMRFLNELNLRPEDIKTEANGDLRVLEEFEREEAFKTDRDGEYARDEKIRVALNRFVDESILRPDAAMRPIWASDPHWMLVFHLKSFIYAFHDRILKRVNYEATQDNAKPALILQMYVPVMIAADMLRAVIQGNWEDDRENWDLETWIAHAYQRAGLYGLAQFGIDEVQSVEYNNLFGLSFAGPVAGSVVDVLDGDVVRVLPAQNIWSNHVE